MDTLKELDDFEIRLLRDFVRGKGKGSVSKLPIDELLKEESEVDNHEKNRMSSLFDLTPNSELDVIPIGGPQFTEFPSSQFPSEFASPPSMFVISSKPSLPNANSLRQPQRQQVQTLHSSSEELPPTSTRIRPKSDAEEVDKDTFKEFAVLLQQLIDIRKGGSVMTTTTTTTTTTSRLTTTLKTRTKKARQQTYPSVIKRLQIEKNDRVNLASSSSNLRKSQPSWQSMQPSQSQDDNSSTEEDWEQKMHELSEQLHSLLSQIKETKKARKTPPIVQTPPRKIKPKVTVLRNGSAEQTPDNQYLFVATITLIQDGGTNILVDTGLGTDINARTNLMKRLGDMRVVPPEISYVVTTHGHPDHAGNTADFPDATHFQGWYVHKQNVFNLSRLFEADRQHITDNVYIIKTPGHTSEDVSVIVQDAQQYGNIAVTGDVFMRMEDSDHPMMWRPLSVNETQQSISRRYLLCTSDYLIPGHGPGFKVTAQMKTKFVC